MVSSNWKRVELEVCRELGGERTGPTGRDLPDCIGTPGLGLEIKAYKRFVFLTADWEQAVRNAERLGAIPALLVRQSGRGGRRRVQMRLADFNEMAAVSPLHPRPESVIEFTHELVRLDWSDFVPFYRGFLARKSHDK